MKNPRHAKIAKISNFLVLSETPTEITGFLQLSQRIYVNESFTGEILLQKNEYEEIVKECTEEKCKKSSNSDGYTIFYWPIHEYRLLLSVKKLSTAFANSKEIYNFVKSSNYSEIHSTKPQILVTSLGNYFCRIYSRNGKIARGKLVFN